MRRIAPHLAVVALFALAFAALAVVRLLGGEEHAEPEPEPEERFRTPPPTEHWLGEGAETRNKARRKAWFRELHKTPPHLDSKQIERANGEAQLRKRNALAEVDGLMRSDAPVPRWVERGSDNLAGRMHVTVHSTDGKRLYAGSALGSVWRRDLDDDGEWVSIGDNLYGGAHWLAVVPNDEPRMPDVVLAATDWGYIHRTDDNGRTWEVPDGVGSPWEVHRLLVTSDGSHTIFLITGTNGHFELLRSTDLGRSFDEVYTIGYYTGDLWTPRTGTSELYLLDEDELLISHDLGDSWETVGSLETGSERGELVGCEAGAPRLWAVLDGNRLYRSDDAGAQWESVTDVSDYWGSLNASVVELDTFAWGGVEVYRTHDGETFEIVNGWGDYYGDPEHRLHADIPGIDVVLDADGDEIWYVSTDGGLYESRDGLRSVLNLSLSGLRVSQYYDTLTSSADPSHVLGGAQDQGYQWSGEGVGDGMFSFEQVISGDYGHLTSGDGSHAYVYSVYPGFIFVQVGEDDPWYDWLDFPAGETYAWLPPVIADPQQSDEFFFCATHLYRYERTGDSWIPSRWSEQSFSDSGWEYMSALAFSPLDPDLAWAATNQGRLFHSIDHGVNWSAAADGGPEGHYFYGTALLPSATDPAVITVAGNGYSGPAAFRSTDGGVTWSAWDDGLPDTLVYSLAEAPDGSGRIFAGTETAAYMRAPDGDAWVDITGNDAPVTIYWSVEALAHENTVRFGTYGRGMWDYQLDPDHTGCFPVQDYDGDGVPCDSDCDDHDPAQFPGADDACDGVDSDCDPDSPVEVDGDGDGYLACAECDDADADINPDAEEVCGNGVDEDCDGGDDKCGCGCTAGGGRTPLGAVVLVLSAFAFRRR